MSIEIIENIRAIEREKGIEQDTLIIWTTDNGAWQDVYPDCGYTPFRGTKGTDYEGGSRVPAIAWWPGTIKAGRRNAEMLVKIESDPPRYLNAVYLAVMFVATIFAAATSGGRVAVGKDASVGGEQGCRQAPHQREDRGLGDELSQQPRPRCAEREADGDLMATSDRRGHHQRRTDVVPVAEVHNAHAFEPAEPLSDREHVGERLAGVGFVGEAVDHRDLRVLGQLLDVVLRERADHDCVGIARQDARRVGDGFAPAELRIGRIQHDALPAELAHGDVEGHGHGLIRRNTDADRLREEGVPPYRD